MYENVMRILEENPPRKTATKRIGLRLKKRGWREQSRNISEKI